MRASSFLWVFLFAPGLARAATPAPLRSEYAMVASDHVEASRAGIELLKAGGNAIDAACATALALGVVNPQSSGLGGGGFAVVYLAKERKVVTLDFREKAPAAITREMFFRDGKLDRKLSTRGGLAVGVPGEPKGLAELVKRWGRRPFADCVRPAERLAQGVPASDRIARLVNDIEQKNPGDKNFLTTVFAYKSPLRAGDVVRRPALAATLVKLRKGGADVFYGGEMARAIVEADRAAGGVMTVEDLRGYTVVERKPLGTIYRGYGVYSMPPPSSGGIVVNEVLGILSERMKDPGALGRNSSAYLHVVAEALKHGFADRARYLGDTDFVDVPMSKLLDPAYHKKLGARVDDAKIFPPESYGLPSGAPAVPPRDGGTAHLSVIDQEGNAVALTTTVNLWFGARIVAGATGIVLNDQMDDFAIEPGQPNAFNLIGTEKNGISPGKRPLSSMAPTIVIENDGSEGAKVKMAVGGAGGPTIISGTLQVMLNVLDWKMDAQAASSAPRIHHQWSPNVLMMEEDFPRDVVAGLERRGHKTATRGHITTVNVVVRGDGGLEGAAEFRSGGAPAGY